MIKLPTLKDATNHLEDAIITLSGPALAISGIIAGVDLLTGGTMLKDASWLSLAWAICLLLSLDFQVLSLGARAHKVYLSPGVSTRRKVCEIVIMVLIAAAISYVSIQMQSIIARSNSVGLDIATATVQLGINPIALIWERSALVFVLIFMSGWFREEKHEQCDQRAITTTNNTTEEALKQLVEQVSHLTVSVTQITTTITEVQTTVTQITQSDQRAITERTEANMPFSIVEASDSQGDQETFAAITQNDQGDQGTNTGERIRAALSGNPELTDRELAAMVGCSSSTANKWRKRIEQQSAA